MCNSKSTYVFSSYDIAASKAQLQCHSKEERREIFQRLFFPRASIDIIKRIYLGGQASRRICAMGPRMSKLWKLIRKIAHKFGWKPALLRRTEARARTSTIEREREEAASWLGNKIRIMSRPPPSLLPPQHLRTTSERTRKDVEGVTEDPGVC